MSPHSKKNLVAKICHIKKKKSQGKELGLGNFLENFQKNHHVSK
jgi:hypothetical protein